MDHELNNDTQQKARELARKITVAHDLDPEIQEELYGHIEDKLMACKSGEESLQAMELLWEDLSLRDENVPSPEWHDTVLREREAALGRGDDEIEDWALAKRRIRSELS